MKSIKGLMSYPMKYPKKMYSLKVVEGLIGDGSSDNNGQIRFRV